MAVVGVVMLGGCNASKKVTMADMNGEWTIVSLRGEALAGDGEEPYIGFDSQDGKVYGNSGCNRLMGSFDTKAASGNLNLGALASTRMMCPEMDVEQRVLSALGEVRHYKRTGDGEFTLYGEDGSTPLVVLHKRCGEMTLSELDGEWLIVRAMDLPAEGSADREPFLAFDTAGGKVHGNTGCNLFNCTFEAGKEPQTIMLASGASTMMACPDMTFEQTTLDALQKVRVYGRLANGNVGLFDGEGTLLLELAAKKK